MFVSDGSEERPAAAMASTASSYDALVSKMQRKQKRYPSWAGLAAEYSGTVDQQEKPVSVPASASGLTRAERKRMRRNAANEAKGLSEEQDPAKAPRKGKARPEVATEEAAHKGRCDTELTTKQQRAHRGDQPAHRAHREAHRKDRGVHRGDRGHRRPG